MRKPDRPGRARVHEDAHAAAASVPVGGSQRDDAKAAQVPAPLCSALCSLLSTTGPSIFLQPITSNLWLIQISCSRMVAPAESGGIAPNTHALITPDRL